MARFIKITDNLSINIDCIYSIYREENKNLPLNIEEINDWEEQLELYKEEELQKNPEPELEIFPGVLYQPGVSEYDELYDELYYQRLSENIIKQFRDPPKPIYTYNYYLLLNNGTKVNIDEIIYNKLMKEVKD